MKAGIIGFGFQLAATTLKTQMEMFSNPVVTFLVMFVTVFMIGLIVSVVR